MKKGAAKKLIVFLQHLFIRHYSNLLYQNMILSENLFSVALNS